MLKEKQLLEDALARGIITPEQYAQMDAMTEDSVNRNPDERFRIVSGFSEVFISVGLLILFNATGALLSALLGGLFGMLIACGLAWMGAIYFNDRKRTLLPSIVCCVYAAHAMGSALWGWQDQSSALSQAWRAGHYWSVIYSLAGAFTVLVAAVWRFRIPFLMLPIGILFAAIVSLAGHAMQNDLSYRLLLAICGVMILSVAITFDLKDPNRVRRSSDFAFWCYVIGSPLTIHSVFLTLLIETGSIRHSLSLFLPVVLIAFSLLVSVAALMLNRRALILSTLIYLGYSIGHVSFSLGVQSAYVVLLPMFLIGLYVVCLGTQWRRVRSALMTRLTPREWFRKLPPF